MFPTDFKEVKSVLTSSAMYRLQRWSELQIVTEPVADVPHCLDASRVPKLAPESPDVYKIGKRRVGKEC